MLRPASKFSAEPGRGLLFDPVPKSGATAKVSLWCSAGTPCLSLRCLLTLRRKVCASSTWTADCASKSCVMIPRGCSHTCSTRRYTYLLPESSLVPYKSHMLYALPAMYAHSTRKLTNGVQKTTHGALLDHNALAQCHRSYSKLTLGF